MRRAFFCLGLAAALGACKEDPAGPAMQQVDFPPLDPTTLAVYCIRGELAPTTTTTGTIGVTRNCPRLEAWRVRVSETTRVGFEVFSRFNSGLGLFEISDIQIYAPGTPLVEDDSGGLNRDARIEHVLEPETEYAIVVVGSNQEDLGPYTLEVMALQ